MSPVASQPRFLLLLPRGHDAPGDLVRGLERRGIRLREVHDPPSVMAALGRAGYAGLVLVEPGECVHADRLLAAVRAYHPDVAVWRYAYAGSPRLARCGPEPAPEPAMDATVPQWEAGPGGQQAREQTGAPGAHPMTEAAGDAQNEQGEDAEAELSGPGPIANGEPAADTDPPEEPGAYLTEEELAMLLEETDLRREGD